MDTHTHDASRRKFLQNGMLAAAMFSIHPQIIEAATRVAAPAPVKVHIFSKHLQFLGTSALADAGATMGFDGIDLTVRPGGHVLPERVRDDLPAAVEAMKKVGLEPVIMTTAVDDADDETDREVLKTASKEGFDLYRMNWLSYTENRNMPQVLDEHAQRLKKLGELNKELGLKGCYQNHAGMLVGASLWEVWHILKEADKNYTGVQYDIRHAMVEGGMSWENGLRLAADRIRSLTVKDFKWLHRDGKWIVQDVPIGEGMVDFRKYFGLLKKYNVDVPMTLHMEYDLGGAEHGSKKITIAHKKVFEAMREDLRKIKNIWNES